LRWIESESTALCAVLDRCGLVCFQPLPDPEPEGLDALWRRKHAVQEGDYDTDFLEKDPALGQPEEPQDEAVADALAAGQPELAAHLPVTRRARQALAYLNAASLPLGWTFRETAGFVGVQVAASNLACGQGFTFATHQVGMLEALLGLRVR